MTDKLHVAIIMDGNGRWARQHGKPRWKGHLAGVDTVRNIVRHAPDQGIGTLTLYTFSSDNWKRTPTEVGRLFWLLREYSRRERRELIEKGVRVTCIGRRDRVSPSAMAALEELENATGDGTRLDLRLAIDYSSRYAIASATRVLAERVARGELKPDDITAETLAGIVGGGCKEPDLLIRTAGEQRLSDFLLWELAYTEFIFLDKYWPEIAPDDIASAIREFMGRDRRFGGVRQGKSKTRLVG